METQQLLNNCLKGKKEAQQELYNIYAAAMLGLCYRYTKSYEDAEDILQDGFIRVFMNLHQFKNDGELGAWIRRIMVNTAITYLNKHSRYRREMNLDDITLHPISDEDPEVKLDGKQLIQLIRQLPSGYQTIFNLVAVEGYNHIEVAKLLEMNVNTVRSQYSRAKSMLLKMMKEYDYESEIENHAGKI
ncbi:MAG TPA: RNA polymerase sigma factor [Chitinophagaceae bacterium]|nr:RNA polymerase sigma factor [Chitinophagaceae bacterium]